MSDSFNFFPQHCLLFEFTTNQHASKVYNELVESIQSMKKPANTQLLKKMANALQTLVTTPAVAPFQRGLFHQLQMVVNIQLKG